MQSLSLPLDGWVDNWGNYNSRGELAMGEAVGFIYGQARMLALPESDSDRRMAKRINAQLLSSRSKFQRVASRQRSNVGTSQGSYSAFEKSDVGFEPLKSPTWDSSDLSTAHSTAFSMFQRINPNAKLIAILREPVARGLSRYMEQYNWPFPFNGFVDKRYGTFEKYADSEISKITTCLEDIAWMKDIGAENDDLKDYLEHMCHLRSNLVGWSAYSIFLKHWLKYFPKEQLMVLYTSDLDRDPMSVMRKIETFLGLEPHAWDENALHTKFNTKKSYGWAAAVKPQLNSSAASKAEQEIRVRANQGGYKKNLPPPKTAAELSGNTSNLVAFFKPHMMRLKEMADQGIIAPIPTETWAPYAS
eukprot:gene17853-24242_t